MSFSKRTSWSLDPNALTRREAELRNRGEQLIDLTESNPTRAKLDLPPDFGPRMLAALALPGSLIYEPTPVGLAAARDAIVGYYAERGVAVTRDEVLLTASTSEAYGSLFKLLADPGDRVLVPAPSYPLFELLAGLEGVEIDNYPLHNDGRWWVDVEALAALVTPRTRAIVAVSPNNPTGSFVKGPEWDAIEKVAEHARLAIIVDEVFSDYRFCDDDDIVPTMLARPARAPTFVLSGLSKVVGLPQLKLGWIVARGPGTSQREAVARLEIVLDTYLSVGAPVQHAAPALLSLRHAAQRAIMHRVRAGAAAVDELLATSPDLRLLPAEGGWYAVLRLPATRTEESWVMALLEEARVLVQPGYFFDFASEPYVVVSLLTETATLREGLGRLASLMS